MSNKDILNSTELIEKYAHQLFDALPTELQNDWAVCTPFNALLEELLKLERKAEQQSQESELKELFECLTPLH